MMPKLYQVALGMAYLHEKNIIHCDLKAVCATLSHFFIYNLDPNVVG
jgi:serine/threonine protein kinase